MNLDDLRAYGADVDEGIARCAGNEELYAKLVGTALTDGGFEELEAAVGAGDLKRAFEAAHSLKGMLANLGIVPLVGPIAEITELLRAETDTDYTDLLAQIAQERDRFRSLC